MPFLKAKNYISTSPLFHCEHMKEEFAVLYFSPIRIHSVSYWVTMDTPTWWFHTCIYRSCCCCNHLFPTRILVAHFTYKFNGSFYTTVVSLSKSLYNHILKRKLHTKNKLQENGKNTKESLLFSQTSFSNFTKVHNWFLSIDLKLILKCFLHSRSSKTLIQSGSSGKEVNLLKHCSLM